MCGPNDTPGDGTRPVRMNRTPQGRVPVSCARCRKTVGSAWQPGGQHVDTGTQPAVSKTKTKDPLLPALRDVRLLRHCIVLSAPAQTPPGPSATHSNVVHADTLPHYGPTAPTHNYGPTAPTHASHVHATPGAHAVHQDATHAHDDFKIITATRTLLSRSLAWSCNKFIVSVRAR